MITQQLAQKAIARAKSQAAYQARLKRFNQRKTAGLASKPKEVLDEVEGLLKYHGVLVDEIRCVSNKTAPYSGGVREFCSGAMRYVEPVTHVLTIAWSDPQ